MTSEVHNSYSILNSLKILGKMRLIEGAMHTTLDPSC